MEELNKSFEEYMSEFKLLNVSCLNKFLLTNESEYNILNSHVKSSLHLSLNSFNQEKLFTIKSPLSYS